MTKIKVIKEKENPFFNRKEVEVFIDWEKCPSREEVSKILSEKFSVPLVGIKIKKILGNFGSKTFTIEANLYSSKENKDSVELKKKKDASSEKSIIEASASG